MSLTLFLQKLHGHAALLGIALALHPYFALRRARRPGRWTRISGYLATGMIALTSVLGWVVYPAYRREIKRDLYVASPVWGSLFEMKEHIAWFALCLSIAGAVMMAMSSGRAGLRLRQPIRASYLLAGVLSLLVGAAGIYLASIKGFAYPY